MESDDRQFVERAKAVLESSAQDLDPNTMAALRQARRQALAAGRPRSRWSPLVIGGMATAAMALLVVFLWGVPWNNGKHGLGVEEMEALVTLEAVEIVDDLEFYEWLAETERTS